MRRLTKSTRRPAVRTPKLGRFVWTFDKYGLGQVIGLQDGRCTVRFFKSINDSLDFEYDTANVEGAYLLPQTRAYVRGEDGDWTVGRVVDVFPEADRIFYDIQFPNRIYRRIPEADLRIRCLLPIEDPTAVLAAGGIETQYLYDRRRAALECLSEARAVSHGITGLLSASVELLPHQVEVARRVLGDPVQRYLLADEVGLGKTIEACAIIRQAILDNPEERVIVLTPASLTGQWGSELASRFFVQAPKHRLLVLSFDHLNRVDPSEVDTLVIDEAHNLIPSEPTEDPTYKTLERIALRARRLLLISATPVLGHERTLLALLHLLDPQTYRLDEEGAFVAKVRRRQEFGRLLLALNPRQRPALLRRTLQLLRELVHEDEVVDQLVASIEEGIQAGHDAALAEAVRALQYHIGDTYRLHQRLVRTRRRDLPADVLAPRASVLATLQEDDDDRTPLLVEALDQWRLRSLEALATIPDSDHEVFERRMADRYARLHEALGISVEACADELREQLESVRTGRELSFESDEDALTFAIRQSEEETFGTRADLAKLVVQNALRVLGQKTRQPRLVVFGTSTGFVQAVADQLDGDPSTIVFRVVQSSDEEDVVKAVEGFLNAPRAAVLTCDRRGEEGLNLQFAHGIVHLDLPLAPARIEQRIGRLDRFGRERNPIREIHHWVVAPYFEDYHPWQAWFELLRNGFKVFDESISEVQFLLDDLQEAVRLALYHRGALGLRELTSHVMDAMAQERQRLDEQYALDRRTTGSVDPEDVFRAIKRVDTERHYLPIDDWLTEVLMFRRQPLDDIHAAFRLHWTHQTLLPREPRHELITEDQLAQPMTYDRGYAAQTRGLRLVRSGLELVDSLEGLLRWDDRGTAFGTWRADPRWTGEGRGIWLGFRLTYVLQANIEAARHSLGDWLDERVVRSLRRRMDALLPPWTTTVDVDIEMNPVTDSLLRDILARPYSDREDELGRRDFNLGSRRDVLYSTIGFAELADACRHAKEASETLLRTSLQFQQWADASVRRAVGQLKTDNERLKRRNDATIKETGRADPTIERDVLINETIIAALRSPSVRLDAIGLFVVSNSQPQKMALKAVQEGTEQLQEMG